MRCMYGCNRATEVGRYYFEGELNALSFRRGITKDRRQKSRVASGMVLSWSVGVGGQQRWTHRNRTREGWESSLESWCSASSPKCLIEFLIIQFQECIHFSRSAFRANEPEFRRKKDAFCSRCLVVEIKRNTKGRCAYEPYIERWRTW